MREEDREAASGNFDIKVSNYELHSMKIHSDSQPFWFGPIRNRSDFEVYGDSPLGKAQWNRFARKNVFLPEFMTP